MPSSPWRTSPLVVGLVALTLPLLLAPGALANPSAGAADRDCSDFDNQRQAQSYFIDRGGPRRDPTGSTPTATGSPCESLPCPCSRAGARPRPKPPRRRAQTIRAHVTSVIDGDTIPRPPARADAPAALHRAPNRDRYA
jgi:hypothetical protein